jgi:hypothetical protein
VVDVDALVQGRTGGTTTTATGKPKPKWWLKIVDLLSEKPVMVGKRKLVPFRHDSFVMLTPLVRRVWLLLCMHI